MSRGRASINSGRYVPIIVNGHRQWARDQVALQADILKLLEQHGGLTKKRIIMTLATAQAAVDTALVTMLRDGVIERYRALSARNRLDEHWCAAGKSPVAPTAGDGIRYNAVAILTAMQQHAASIHAGSANK
jgi:predicted transcriptional regulator